MNEWAGVNDPFLEKNQTFDKKHDPGWTTSNLHYFLYSHLSKNTRKQWKNTALYLLRNSILIPWASHCCLLFSYHRGLPSRYGILPAASYQIFRRPKQLYPPFFIYLQTPSSSHCLTELISSLSCALLTGNIVDKKTILPLSLRNHRILWSRCFRALFQVSGSETGPPQLPVITTAIISYRLHLISLHVMTCHPQLLLSS